MLDTICSEKQRSYTYYRGVWGGIFIEGEPFVDSVVDFSKPTNLKLKGEGVEKLYTVYVHTYTGLPILWIDTGNRVGVTSKEEYVNAYLRLEEGVVTRAPGDIIESEILIKGQ